MVTRPALAVLLSGCLRPGDPGALVPPTADQDPDLPQVALTVAGRTRAVHLQTWGDPAAPPLLVLHGSLADARSLRVFTPLADRYHVVLWDQRGSGLSERITAEEFSWDSVAAEVDAVREAVAPGQSVTLIGHSFGAMFAADYLGRHPDRVAAAVLIEPPALTGDIFTATFDDNYDIRLFDPDLDRVFWQSETLSAADHEAMDYKALQLLAGADQTVGWYCDDAHPPPSPLWRPGAHVEYLRGVIMGSAGLQPPRFAFDLTEGLDEVTAPVLLVGGACSALGPEHQARWHLPLFPTGTVATVDDAGHRLHVERPDALLDLLDAWLPLAPTP